MSSLPLWGGKKSIKKKRKKKHKIQTTWSQKLSCIFLQCNSIKPKLLVLTQLIRSLAQLTHHKEEIQPWTRGWGAGGGAMSSAHRPYSSTGNKNHLVSTPATGPTGTASIFGENFQEPGEWMGILKELREKVHRAFPTGTELFFWFFMACF